MKWLGEWRVGRGLDKGSIRGCRVDSWHTDVLDKVVDPVGFFGRDGRDGRGEEGEADEQKEKQLLGSDTATAMTAAASAIDPHDELALPEVDRYVQEGVDTMHNRRSTQPGR